MDKLVSLPENGQFFFFFINKFILKFYFFLFFSNHFLSLKAVSELCTLEKDFNFVWPMPGVKGRYLNKSVAQSPNRPSIKNIVYTYVIGLA